MGSGICLLNTLVVREYGLVSHFVNTCIVAIPNFKRDYLTPISQVLGDCSPKLPLV